MTTYDKQTLKTYFQTGDVPTGNDYANLIDSQVNVAETSAQSMLGALIVPEVIASRVSCGNIAVTGTFSAANFTVGTLNTTALNTATASATVLNTSRLAVSTSAEFICDANVSGNWRFNSIVNFDRTININQEVAIKRPGVISIETSGASANAAGTTQGTATLLTPSRPLYICAGVVNGSSTGFILRASQSTGEMYYIWNPGLSANLYPSIGCSINALAVNAPLPLPPGTFTTIVHVGASAYGAIQ
jgi:hypothetical protein